MHASRTPTFPSEPQIYCHNEEAGLRHTLLIFLLFSLHLSPFLRFLSFSSPATYLVPPRLSSSFPMLFVRRSLSFSLSISIHLLCSSTSPTPRSKLAPLIMCEPLFLPLLFFSPLPPWDVHGRSRCIGLYFGYVYNGDRSLALLVFLFTPSDPPRVILPPFCSCRLGSLPPSILRSVSRRPRRSRSLVTIIEPISTARLRNKRNGVLSAGTVSTCDGNTVANARDTDPETS